MCASELQPAAQVAGRRDPPIGVMLARRQEATLTSMDAPGPPADWFIELCRDPETEVRVALMERDPDAFLIAYLHAEGVQVDARTHCLATPQTGFSEAEWREFAALLTLRPDQITTDEAVATQAAWLARTGGQ